MDNLQMTAQHLANLELGYLAVFFETLTGLAWLHIFIGKHSMSAENFEKFRRRRKTFEEAYELAAAGMVLRVLFRDVTMPMSVILLLCVQIPAVYLITGHASSFDRLRDEAIILAILFSPVMHDLILPLWHRGFSQWIHRSGHQPQASQIKSGGHPLWNGDADKKNQYGLSREASSQAVRDDPQTSQDPPVPHVALREKRKHENAHITEEQSGGPAIRVPMHLGRFVYENLISLPPLVATGEPEDGRQK